jgi:phosphatidylserine decarboxylase
MSNNPRASRRTFYWHFLNRLPQNAMSRLAGRFAGVKMPRSLMRFVINRFIKKFKIDVNEIAKPLESFESLQSFFIRELKDGLRPVDGASEAITSPCDGAYGQNGVVEKGLLLQVKGKSFRLADLLCDEKWSEALEGGSYAVLYLSPKDYHRFHAPADMFISEASHVPGRLWPVNLWAVDNVDEVFCVNERIVMKCVESGQSDSPFAIVAVGATMVGKVKLAFDEKLSTNERGSAFTRKSYAALQSTLNKGQELGRFEFGSTLVVVLPSKMGSLELRSPGTPIKMGQRIGTRRA